MIRITCIIVFCFFMNGCNSENHQYEYELSDSATVSKTQLETKTEIKAMVIDHFDSLQKYSYFCYTEFDIGALKVNNPGLYKRMKLDSGALPRIAGFTGFFLRNEGKLYFITAYHAVTGTEVYTQSRQEFSGEKQKLNIRYFENGTVRYYDGIDINQILKNSPVINAAKVPDIFIYELNEDLPVHSLEEFVMKEPDKEKNKGSKGYSICFWGFPNPVRTLEPEKIAAIKSTAYLNGHIANFEQKGDINTLHHIITPKSAPGASGSPVFKLYSDGKEIWADFLGILSGVDEHTVLDGRTFSTVLKAEEVRKVISQKINN